MHFALVIAAHRARQRAGQATGNGALAAGLWELAERYHPEEVWLAESYLRGERKFEELARTAPRGRLAPALLATVRLTVQPASQEPIPNELGGYAWFAEVPALRVGTTA